MYKHLFLDLDNTLLDFDAAEEVALKKAFLALDIVPTESLLARYRQINEHLWEQYELGQVARDELLVKRYDLLFAERGIAVPGWKCEEIYRKYLGVGHYFVPGAEDVLAYLSGKGYQLYLASNGLADTQYSRLESAGIGHYFAQIFISGSTGHHKPEAAYFQYCFSHIPGFSSSQALMIGDTLSSDIQGGKNAGIATCWLNRKGKTPPPALTPDYEIRRLEELKAIL